MEKLGEGNVVKEDKKNGRRIEEEVRGKEGVKGLKLK